MKEIEGDVRVIANYLSHPFTFIISYSLAIRFTEDVVILRNRANNAPVHLNFRPVSLVLVWPQFTPFPPHVKFYVFFISLCPYVPILLLKILLKTFSKRWASPSRPGGIIHFELSSLFSISISPLGLDGQVFKLGEDFPPCLAISAIEARFNFRILLF